MGIAPGKEAGLEPADLGMEDKVRIVTKVTSIKVILMTPSITLYCSNIVTEFSVLIPLRPLVLEKFESKQIVSP